MALHRLGILLGDGIGPEIVPATTRVIDAVVQRAAGVTIEWTELPIGWQGIKECGDATPPSTVAALAELDGWVMGPHDNASYPDEHRQNLNPSGKLRQHFQLYANIRPSRNLPGVPALVEDTDLVIARENTEGFYGDRNMYRGYGEVMPTADVALVTGLFTRAAIERIAHTAFRLAGTRRKRVTIVHKANVLKMTSGMFKSICIEIGAQYPDVEIDDFHIDAMAALLVRKPEAFDVVVTENMFGDILSDLTGELVGSLGTAGGLNAGDDTAMAQAAHGSAPDIAGQDMANPIGMMVSGWQLLRWRADRSGDDGLMHVADTCETGMVEALRAGHRTGDLGGELGTEGFADQVIAHLP